MNSKVILSVLGTLLRFLGLMMIVPLLLALYYHESSVPFLIGMGLTEIAGIYLWLRYKSDDDWKLRETFAVVALSWLVAMFLDPSHSL
jgi:trk system potassium uptake protein TrkH